MLMHRSEVHVVSVLSAQLLVYKLVYSNADGMVTRRLCLTKYVTGLKTLAAKLLVSAKFTGYRVLSIGVHVHPSFPSCRLSPLLLVGGCCRVTPEDIFSIREHIKHIKTRQN